MEPSKYKAIIEAIGEIDITQSDLDAMDLATGPDGLIHVLSNGTSYRVEVLEADRSTKSYRLKVNNEILEVTLQDEYQVLVHNMGLDKEDSGQVLDVKAPMPGLIIEVRCKPGDQVSIGDTLVVLEAMKMENVLNAPADGTVSEIHVSKGDAVERGQLLISFE